MMTDERAQARTVIAKACTNREMREVMLYACIVADKVRLTKKGVRFYGPNGTVGAHFTASDHRARENFIRDLRQAGL